MAKSKRNFIRLKCSECKKLNYTTRKKRTGEQVGKLELKKFCPKCRKHTLHKETKIS